MATLANLVVRIAADTSQFINGVAKANAAAGTMGASMTSAGKKMTSVGRSMTMGVTLPVLAAGAAAIKTTADFDRTMQTMSAVAKVPQKDIGRLSTLAIKMGQDTIFSANEAAAAMLNLAKGGIKPAEIEAGALANTLDLAAAGDLELADAARIAAQSMNVFNLSGAESKRAVDALSGAANASSGDVSDFAIALGQGGSSAARFGLTVEQTAAMLALMADKGIRGSDAGTLLKSSLRTLVPITEKARDKMRELGLDFFDAQGNFIGIMGVAKELKTELGGLSTEQRELAINTIFGSDAARMMGILSKEGAQGILQYTKATKDMNNANEVAKAKMQGLPGALEKFKGSLETAGLAAGNAAKGPLTFLLKGLTTLLNGFTALPGPVRSAIVVFLALSAAVGPLTFIFGKLLIGMGTVIGPLKTLTAATKAYTVAAALSGNTVGGLKAVFGGLVGTLSQKSTLFAAAATKVSGFVAAAGGIGPALLSVAGPAAVAAAAIYTVVKVNEAGTFAQQEQNKMLMASVPLIEAHAKSAMKGLKTREDLVRIIEQQISHLQEEGANEEELTAVREAGTAALARYDEAKKVAVKTTEGYITMSLKAARATAEFAGMGRKEYGKWQADTVGNFNLVNGALDKMANKHKVTADQILESLQKALQAQRDFSKNWSTVVQRAGKDGEDFVKHLQEQYGAQAPALLEALAGSNKKTFNEIISTWRRGGNEAWHTSRETGKAFDEIPKGMAKAGRETATEVTKIPAHVRRATGPTQSASTAVGQAIAAGMASGVRSGQSSVIAATIAVADAAVAGARNRLGIKSPSKVFEGIGQNIIKGLVRGLRQLGALDSALDKLTDKLSNKVGKAVDKIESDLEKKLEGIKATKGISGAVEAAMIKAAESASEKAIKQLEKFESRYTKWAEKLQKQAAKVAKYVENLEERISDFRGDIKSGFEGFGNFIDHFSGKPFIDAKENRAAIDAIYKELNDKAREAREAGKELDQSWVDSMLERAEELRTVMSESASGTNIRNYLVQQLQESRNFAEKLTALAEKGLNQGLLRELASGGAEAMGTMEALLADGSGDLIKFANQTQAELDKIMVTTANNLQDVFFGEEMKQAKVMVGDLNKEIAQFNEAMARDAKKLGVDLDGLGNNIKNLGKAIAQTVASLTKAMKDAQKPPPPVVVGPGKTPTGTTTVVPPGIKPPIKDPRHFDPPKKYTQIINGVPIRDFDEKKAKEFMRDLELLH